jgi:Cu+-exporting ATPase
MTVAPDSKHHTMHAGHDYRFCSAGCRAKFIADPARYVASATGGTPASPAALTPQGASTAQNVPAASPEPAATKYTCPMHPEIVRDAPGHCPICGMALEPVMPSLDDDEHPELTDFRRRFWLTLPLSFAVLVLAMFGHRWTAPSATARSWLELALSVPVVLWAGWPFFVRWAQSIANRSLNMWTLIGTGIAAAFGYSLVATIAPDIFPESFREHGRVGVYFEAAACRSRCSARCSSSRRGPARPPRSRRC